MFFTPRYVKEGRELLHAVRRALHYRHDVLPPAELQQAEGLQATLREALRQRDPERVRTASAALQRFANTHFPAPSALGENVEVFMVAFVIAIAIRTFFFQPFTIPTGSMQPTLNGIRVVKTEAAAPNALQRVAEYVTRGRNYFEITPQADDTVLRLSESKRFMFFYYTTIEGARQSFTVRAPLAGVVQAFGLQPGSPLRGGETLRGYADAGDFLFVNKMAYHFRAPRRGEVFIFTTMGIPTDPWRNPYGPSQYYIKRLAGLPGDELRIAAPLLFINGQEAQEAGFRRVMSAQDGYQGYANMRDWPYLNTPSATYRLPAKRYFALGDNSYNSGDSRYWGSVPQENLVGCGFIVFWPFTPHWGLIR